MRIDPHLIGMIWNQIGFAGEAGHPETVIGIGGKQRQECRRWMGRIAHRYMQFVCGNDVQLRIAIFPPILMPDHGHLERSGRTVRVLNRHDHTRGREEQGHNDENGNYGPSQFHLRAPVDLRGLTAVIVVLMPESHRRVGEQTENDNKDRCYGQEDENRQSEVESAGVDAGVKMLVGLIVIAANLVADLVKQRL